MRKIAGLVLAAALAVPATFLIAPAGAAGGVSCQKGTRGIESFNPPLIRTGSTEKTRSTITIGGAKLSGCKNGGVKSGTLSAKVRWLDPGNCDSLYKYTPDEAFPRIRGTITIVWNTNETSTATVSVGRNKPYVQPVTGTVTKGKFKGSSFFVWFGIVPQNGACQTRDMRATKFVSMNALRIK